MFTTLQKPSLDSRKTNGDGIVAQTMVQGKRMYTTFSNADKYIDFINSGEDGSEFCNELLWGPVSTFFDLDCPLQVPELGFDSMSGFISGFNDLLVRVYDEKVRVYDESISWSSVEQKEHSMVGILQKRQKFLPYCGEKCGFSLGKNAG